MSFHIHYQIFYKTPKKIIPSVWIRHKKIIYRLSQLKLISQARAGIGSRLFGAKCDDQKASYINNPAK